MVFMVKFILDLVEDSRKYKRGNWKTKSIIAIELGLGQLETMNEIAD